MKKALVINRIGLVLVLTILGPFVLFMSFLFIPSCNSYRDKQVKERMTLAHFQAIELDTIHVTP